MVESLEPTDPCPLPGFEFLEDESESEGSLPDRCYLCYACDITSSEGDGSTRDWPSVIMDAMVQHGVGRVSLDNLFAAVHEYFVNVAQRRIEGDVFTCSKRMFFEHYAIHIGDPAVLDAVDKGVLGAAIVLAAKTSGLKRNGKHVAMDPKTTLNLINLVKARRSLRTAIGAPGSKP